MFGTRFVATYWSRIIVLLALAICVVYPETAYAQSSDTVAITGANFALPRVVVPNETASTIRANPSNGSIQRVNGNAQFMGPSQISVPTVTITCDRSVLSSSNCNRNTVMSVTISSTSSSRARLSMITVSPMSGSVTYGPMVRNGDQVTFNLTFNANRGPQTASFRLGFDVVLSASQQTGSMLMPYTVTISRP